MDIEVSTTTKIAEDNVFIEEFTVSLEEEGLVIRCVSPQFEAFIRRFKPLRKATGTMAAYDTHEKPWFYPSSGSFNSRDLNELFNPSKETIIINTADRSLVPNLSFLLIEGLGKGVKATAILPVSISEATDFYHNCLMMFQSLYIEWLRPFTASASLKEVFNADK